MASFVIHYIAGENFLSTLESRFNFKFTDSERKKFLLGNLIVDSIRIKKPDVSGLDINEEKAILKQYRYLVQKEKVATHFRSFSDKDLCIQAPIITDFSKKYKDLFEKDISVLGYLFHLYTDKMFFDDLFSASFVCLDSNGKETNLLKNACNVKILKNNKIISLREFNDAHSKTSVYTDYTTMNKILLEYYGCSFDGDYLLSEVSEFINPGITEVDYDQVSSVIHKTQIFIKESYECETNELNIFDEKLIKQFINTVVSRFIMEYPKEIESSLGRKRECLKR